MDEKPPRKRKITKGKQSSDIKSKTKIDSHELLQEILQEKIRFDQNYEREVQDLNKALVLTLSEFLACFTVLGFNNEGDPIVISYSKNDMQHAALNTLLIKFFTAATQNFNKPPSSGDLYD